MAKQLNVSVHSLPLAELNATMLQQSFYESCIDNNQLPIECQNRSSQLNESKRRQYWTRSCFQGYSTILFTDSYRNRIIIIES